MIDALALIAPVVFIGTVGCQTPTGGAANPFLAPNRVPPPATRALQPGEAQPYYPGDPLPVMQSSTSGADNSATLAVGQAPQTPTADSAFAPNMQASGAAANNHGAEAQRLTTSGQASIAIPGDDESLRFALPAPAEPEPFIPVDAAPMPSPPAAKQFVAAPGAPPVSAASYAEASLAGQAQPGVGDVVSLSPWRSPDVAQWTPPPQAVPAMSLQGPSQSGVLALPPPPAPGSASPAMMPSSMPVRLRGVPSPPPDGTFSSAPRIRLPSGANVAQTTSRDGFRPRSSMR